MLIKHVSVTSQALNIEVFKKNANDDANEILTTKNVYNHVAPKSTFLRHLIMSWPRWKSS